MWYQWWYCLLITDVIPSVVILWTYNKYLFDAFTRLKHRSDVVPQRRIFNWRKKGHTWRSRRHFLKNWDSDALIWRLDLLANKTEDEEWINQSIDNRKRRASNFKLAGQLSSYFSILSSIPEIEANNNPEPKQKQKFAMRKGVEESVNVIPSIIILMVGLVCIAAAFF